MAAPAGPSGPKRVASGTRLVAGFLALAVIAGTAFLLYARHAMETRPPDSPESAAGTAVRADNTAVGLLGGIREVVVRGSERSGDTGFATATVVADVVGARDTATFRAELRGRDGRWFFADGTLAFPDGRSIPIRGSPGY